MKFFERSSIIRCGIIGFWLSMIFLFLFSPLIMHVFTQPKSLNLFIWPMILDPRVLAEFEQETGIKVYLNYYESNEELYSKLKATKGQGYDLIVPTDYTVERLIQDGLLKKIDKTKLDFFGRIKPDLVGHYFDPANDYSLPYYVSVFGFGINKNYFNGGLEHATWGLVFDEQQVPARICMIDSAREAILLAAHYLYGTIDTLHDPDHLQEVGALLSKQKKWVEVYTSARVEELLASSSSPLAVGTSPDVWKAAREYSHIGFVVPEDGSFITIDSFVMPKTTTKDALIYQLLNFLYRPGVLAQNSRNYGFCPPVNDVVGGEGIFCPTPEQFKKFSFFRNVLTKQQMQDLWISVKSR